MLKEFTAFLLKTNALALAVGVIIGAATSKVVTAVVDDLLMPPIATVMPPGDWREAQIELSRAVGPDGKTTVNAIKYGHLVGALVDFVIIAFVVYVLTNKILPKEKAPEAPETKTCEECLEIIPLAAKRCKFCTAVVVV